MTMTILKDHLDTLTKNKSFLRPTLCGMQRTHAVSAEADVLTSRAAIYDSFPTHTHGGKVPHWGLANHWEQFGVQYLAQGHSDVDRRRWELSHQPCDQWTTPLPPEPQPPQHLIRADYLNVHTLKQTMFLCTKSQDISTSAALNFIKSFFI